MNPFLRAIIEVQEAALMTGRAFRRAFSKPYYIREIIIQMDVIGVGSLMIIVLTGVFTGGILALQSAKTLKTFGAQSQTGLLVMTSMVREMGPVLASLMLAGLRTHGGTVGVGRSTTQAVVTSDILILASDFFLSKLILAFS
jgi:phospholipid/cholesterol/gamma-HCH transport system permease protein